MTSSTFTIWNLESPKMDCFQGVSFSIRSHLQLEPFVFQLVHSLLGKSEPIRIFQGKTTKKKHRSKYSDGTELRTCVFPSFWLQNPSSHKFPSCFGGNQPYLIVEKTTSSWRNPFSNFHDCFEEKQQKSLDLFPPPRNQSPVTTPRIDLGFLQQIPQKFKPLRQEMENLRPPTRWPRRIDRTSELFYEATPWRHSHRFESPRIRSRNQPTKERLNKRGAFFHTTRRRVCVCFFVYSMRFFLVGLPPKNACFHVYKCS